MLEKVIGIIADQLGISTDEISENTKLTSDLGVDSLEIFEVVMTLEEEFGIEIPNEDIEGIATVKDIVDYVNKKSNS